MIRILGVALLTGLLAACSSGNSILEWDPETQAMLDAQEAQAEAARNQASMTDEEILAQAQAQEQGVAPAAPAAVAPTADALQAPLVLLDAQGGVEQGLLVRDLAKGTTVQVLWADGSSCSGGLVQEGTLADGPNASAGTFALNCSDGTIWLGKYADLMPGQGAWAMHDAHGLQARAVFGTDVPASPVDAGAFESLWSARATTPAV